MSAYDEVQAGKAGEEFLQLLARTVYAVATSRNFPPPDGGAWSRETAADVATSFLADDRTQRRLDWLALRCGNEQELARALQGVVRNYLRDRGRATELGRLVVRIKRVLKECDDFVKVESGRWTLRGGPAEASGVGPDSLVTAAAAVPVTFASYGATAKRREPFADKASLEALVTAVLGTAHGSVLASEIARAIAPSVQVVSGNVLVELDVGDYPDSAEDLGATGDIGASVAVRARALEVLELLSDRERIALARLEVTTRDLGRLLGLGHSQAAVVRARATEVLKGELADDEDGQEIVEVILELARFWVTERTNLDVETYGTD